MSSVVADTHAAVWFINGSSKLSPRARSVLAGAVSSGFDVIVSAVSVSELIYLVEKGRIPESDLAAIVAALRRPDSAMRCRAFDLDIAVRMRDVSRASVPELPDRIIAATALHLGLPLVTRDLKIRASNVNCIW